MAFGKAVRKARKARGISQEALADLAGLHRTYVGDVERGERNISLLNMSKIARAMHLKLSEMVSDSEKHLKK
jgi:transcriptional regulator with XRE-family HTH domain